MCEQRWTERVLIVLKISQLMDISGPGLAPNPPTELITRGRDTLLRVVTKNEKKTVCLPCLGSIVRRCCLQGLMLKLQVGRLG